MKVESVKLKVMERKSFVFRKGWSDAISGLPDDVRLEVYEAIIGYGISGETPKQLKPMARLAFNFVKTTLDEDVERYDEIKKARSEAGRKGMEKRWGKKSVETDAGDNKCYSPITSDNKNNYNDYVNDNVILLPIGSGDKSAPAPACEDVNDKYLEKFFNSKKSLIEKLLMDFGLKPDEVGVLKDMAQQVVNEWKLCDTFHAGGYADWSQHLISTMRIKMGRQKVEGSKLKAVASVKSKEAQAAEARAERDRQNEELQRRLDAQRRSAVSYEDARNSEEYRRAMEEA